MQQLLFMAWFCEQSSDSSASSVEVPAASDVAIPLASASTPGSGIQRCADTGDAWLGTVDAWLVSCHCGNNGAETGKTPERSRVAAD